MKRLEKMIMLLPEAVAQANTRIITEGKVENEDKLISVYHEHVNVIKRGKAGGQVEFGNTLFLSEQARFEVPSHKWVDMSESGFGVAMLKNCKYGLEISSDALQLQSLKCAEDGSGDLILRLVELRGSRDKARIKLIPGKTWASVVETDLLERPLQEAELDEETVIVDYRPNEILTLRFKA